LRQAVAGLERPGFGDHTAQLVGTLSGGQRQRVAVPAWLAALSRQI
jgi:ABC-type phosphate/phosphonate transport system ATPase subunit